jgi:hypothetical protein
MAHKLLATITAHVCPMRPAISSPSPYTIVPEKQQENRIIALWHKAGMKSVFGTASRKGFEMAPVGSFWILSNTVENRTISGEGIGEEAVSSCTSGENKKFLAAGTNRNL